MLSQLFLPLSSPVEPPYERHGLALPDPCPESRCRPSSHYSAAGSDFEASRVPDLWLVLNDDFRPAASHIRSSPGEADRLAARIGPQTQREQIGETEGSLDV